MPIIELQELPERPEFGSVTVRGLSARFLSALTESAPDQFSWTDLFAVYTGEFCPAPGEQRAVLGTYSVEADGIRFRPRFPFDAGLNYCARFDSSRFNSPATETSAKGEALELVFSLPQPEREEPVRVEAVYPSGEHVPANLLRLYVHFSAPMRGKEVYRFIHLYDSAGEEVLLPFVEIPQGLWDPTQTRLTLFFHPGRIKRDVGPNLALGSPLREGATYRLVVDSGLQSIDGASLSDNFEREFVAGPEDRASPDPEEWLIESPRDAKDSLELVFGESLDHALLQRMIWVVDESGESLDGTITVEDEETRWIFIPASTWVDSDYLIMVDPALEDLAGNAIDHLFEEESRVQEVPDPADAGDASANREVRSIPFHIR